MLLEIVFFSLNGFASDPCEKIIQQVLNSKPQPGKIVEVRRGRARFVVRDSNAFELDAYVNPDGELSLSAILAIPELAIRSSMSGSRLFSMMMKNYSNRGTQIKRILGRWNEGVNFDMYQANLKAGMSPEDAAKNTWTGRQAAKYGYTKVTVTSEKNKITGLTTHLPIFSKP